MRSLLRRLKECCRDETNQQRNARLREERVRRSIEYYNAIALPHLRIQYPKTLCMNGDKP